MNLYNLHSNPEELDHHDTFGKIMDQHGRVIYRDELGRPHRDNDQPAVIYSNGGKEWWINGERHRDNDQPAVIYSNGDKIWYKDGKRHRDNDKPAVIYAFGMQHWYKNGVEYLPKP